MSKDKDKFFIPLPNADGRKASFRMSEADKRKFLASFSYPPTDSVSKLSVLPSGGNFGRRTQNSKGAA
jgi:hypothetical protein